jgi:hypothetical protein
VDRWIMLLYDVSGDALFLTEPEFAALSSHHILEISLRLAELMELARDTLANALGSSALDLRDRIHAIELAA